MANEQMTEKDEKPTTEELLELAYLLVRRVGDGNWDAQTIGWQGSANRFLAALAEHTVVTVAPTQEQAERIFQAGLLIAKRALEVGLDQVKAEMAGGTKLANMPDAPESFITEEEMRRDF